MHLYFWVVSFTLIAYTFAVDLLGQKLQMFLVFYIFLYDFQNTHRQNMEFQM
jgi:hypothetical protein